MNFFQDDARFSRRISYRHHSDTGFELRRLREKFRHEYYLRRKYWPPINHLILPFRYPQDSEVRLACAILDWEESVRWMARSWDCWDEYETDVWSRIVVKDEIERCMKLGRIPSPALIRYLTSIDRAFRRVTFALEKMVVGVGFFRSMDHRQWWFLYRLPNQMTAEERLKYSGNDKP